MPRQDDEHLQSAGRWPISTTHPLAKKGFLSRCQARAYSVEYHSSVRYALVDAAKDPYNHGHQVSSWCDKRSTVCMHPAVVERGQVGVHNVVVCMAEHADYACCNCPISLPCIAGKRVDRTVQADQQRQGSAAGASLQLVWSFVTLAGTESYGLECHSCTDSSISASLGR